MIFPQQVFLCSFALVNLFVFIKGLQEVSKKKRAYQLTNNLFFIGAFVWGDVLVLSPFWILVSGISLYLQSWNLFLLSVSLFWSIRSFGEVIYWLNEQFAGKNRNPPQNLNFHTFIRSDAIWFMYQLFWQCVFVFAIIFSLYFGKKWLELL